MTIEKKRETIAYLEEQKAERFAKIAEYKAAKADLEEAQARLDAIGDVSDYEAEIFKIDEFIAGIEEEIAELGKPAFRDGGECAVSNDVDDDLPAEEFGSDEVVNNCQA